MGSFINSNLTDRGVPIRILVRWMLKRGGHLREVDAN